ncbi:19458_t:CDS:2 [Gigaspora margarita]|uniref:19458_t:CDS:1 n=1 Tax=Gigaspora margarita TaxID=4874 RepID=A0ABM8VZH7_GIGMA|nr:19458_t:CDS:2 [Gigaspora margarita]
MRPACSICSRIVLVAVYRWDILVQSGSKNGITEFGGDVVKNNSEDINLNVQNNKNNVNVSE